MVTMAMAAATKHAMVTATRWRVTKRAMARAAREMTTATKRTMVMAARGNGNSDKEGKVDGWRGQWQ